MFIHKLESLSEMVGSASKADAFVRSGDLFSGNRGVSHDLHDVYRCKADDRIGLPNVIKPAHGDMQDFFANVATYYPHHAPISAMAYVLSSGTESLFSERPTGMIGATSTQVKLRRAYLGAAIGEATLAGLNVADANQSMSYAACKRTLAYNLGRAATIHGFELHSRLLAERWTKLRLLAGLVVAHDSVEVALDVHDALSGTDHLRSEQIALPLRRALAAIGDQENNDDFLLPILLALYPKMQSHIQDLAGVFDGRMTAFTQLVDAIQADSHGARTDEFAIAFACNRILPGSFAHVGILARLTEFFPAALIWYGLLAAISKPSPNQHIHPALIAKLERDLVDPFSFEERPRCDVSYEELEVLAQSTLRSDLIKPSHQRTILVALLPGVDIYTRFGSENESSGYSSYRDHAANELHARIAKLLEEALRVLRTGTQVGSPTKVPPSRRSRRER